MELSPSTIFNRWLCKVAIFARFLYALISLFVPGRFGGNEDGIDVSMTSYGSRIAAAGIAIASFCLGSDAIRRVYFTIDNEERPAWWKSLIIKLLMQKGVEILRGPSRGPHSKYWYYLHNKWDGLSSFFLIDDDVVYKNGIADLLFTGAKDAPFNACVRALVFITNGVEAPSYRLWPICTNKRTGPDVFATNVGGVVVKMEFSQKLIELGETYKVHCKTVDDVWFHWVGLRYDMPTTQIVSEFVNPTPIPFTQATALSNTVNVRGNDLAVCGLYSQDDLSKAFAE